MDVYSIMLFERQYLTLLSDFLLSLRNEHGPESERLQGNARALISTREEERDQK